MVSVQKIRKSSDTAVEVAIKYYSLISALNDLNLTDRETELLAYTAIKGTISSSANKKEFIRLFGGSIAYINNMVMKLTNKGLLIMEEHRYIVNPSITPDFNHTLLLQIKLELKDAE